MHLESNVKVALGILGILLLFAGFFLAMAFTPIGWIILLIGGLVLVIALAKNSIDWTHFFGRPKPRHVENARRGPNDDPMR